MYIALLIVSISLLFLLFFGVMMLGNKVAHTIEYLQAKEADQELAEIDEMMKQFNENGP
ncbi:hypothetical protein N0O92_06730 [Alkalihalobacillus sp. MEB130]|uniref:hypothetical protein n=1 Tax=Alkalihalobacillus sp. MEB130 TaxID=2976704 RepID=UPI0028DF425E|nr:hypothetical protein [Alkalihalobacillus sp. MEB130]MDT8859922.1 hypothetical protein [Alkalihalobacillus sp. MEB130]